MARAILMPMLLPMAAALQLRPAITNNKCSAAVTRRSVVGGLAAGLAGFSSAAFADDSMSMEEAFAIMEAKFKTLEMVEELYKPLYLQV